MISVILDILVLLVSQVLLDILVLRDTLDI